MTRVGVDSACPPRVGSSVTVGVVPIISAPGAGLQAAARTSKMAKVAVETRELNSRMFNMISDGSKLRKQTFRPGNAK